MCYFTSNEYFTSSEYVILLVVNMDGLTLSPPAFWYYVKHRGGEEKARPLGIALRAVKMRARWWYHNY